MATGYDASKAATYNKLRQQGLSEDAAAAQAGISNNDFANYTIGDNGQLGPNNGAGISKVAGKDYDLPTPADRAESDRFNRGLQSSPNFEQVEYAQTSRSNPDLPKPMNYTTTSTETVSGGGTQSVVAGPRIPNADSRAIGTAYEAKQAEYNQFIKDNPSDYARQKQGLPPMTPEEKAERQEKLAALSKEKADLKQQQIDAETAGPPSETFTPNTTTTEKTTTFSKSNTDQPVNEQNDPQTFRQTEVQLGSTVPTPPTGQPAAVQVSAVQQPTVPAVPVNPDPVPGDALAAQERAAANQVQNTTPTPVTTQLAEQPPTPPPTRSPANQNTEDDPSLYPPPTPSVTEGAVEIKYTEQQISNLQADKNRYEEAIKYAESQGDEGLARQNQRLLNDANQKLAEQEQKLVNLQEQQAVAEGEAATATKAPAPVPAGDAEQQTAAEVIGATPAPKPVPPSAVATTTAAADKAAPQQNPDVKAAEAGSATAAGANNAKLQSVRQARKNQPSAADWRVRLSLAPNADYLYNAKDAGILAPLAATDGVIFPYTPSIEANYKAKYNPYDLVHSNYRGYFYQNSSVDEISVKGTFTAQDTKEAQYLLAVIHFFRSVTKMFYGQDAQAGTPPPLVFLSGLGQYQFNEHPCVVSNFNYSLPQDVDYIRANGFNQIGLNLENRRTQSSGPAAGGGIPSLGTIATRLLSNALTKGAEKQPPVPGAVAQTVTNQNSINSTYVPTKMEISITLLPMQTRNNISQQFSLQGFAQGRLLQGGFW